MKGIVFNLLEDVVTRAHGAATWDALLDQADLDGAYTSLGSYSDDEAFKLVQAASTALGISGGEVLTWFGREAMPILAEKYPGFFRPHTSVKPFLLTLNNIIHPEVRKIYPGADVPVFDFDETPDGALVMGYASARKLCALAQGFIEGAAGHYGERISFEQTQCMHKGDPKCIFHVRFLGAAA